MTTPATRISAILGAMDTRGFHPTSPAQLLNSGTPFQITGATATSFSDSGRSWATNQLVGQVVTVSSDAAQTQNVTQLTITSNNGTTANGTGGWTNGTPSSGYYTLTGGAYINWLGTWDGSTSPGANTDWNSDGTTDQGRIPTGGSATNNAGTGTSYDYYIVGIGSGPTDSIPAGPFTVTSGATPNVTLNWTNTVWGTLGCKILRAPHLGTPQLIATTTAGATTYTDTGATGSAYTPLAIRHDTTTDMMWLRNLIANRQANNDASHAAAIRNIVDIVWGEWYQSTYYRAWPDYEMVLLAGWDSTHPWLTAANYMTSQVYSRYVQAGSGAIVDTTKNPQSYRVDYAWACCSMFLHYGAVSSNATMIGAARTAITYLLAQAIHPVTGLPALEMFYNYPAADTVKTQTCKAGDTGQMVDHMCRCIRYLRGLGYNSDANTLMTAVRKLVNVALANQNVGANTPVGWWDTGTNGGFFLAVNWDGTGLQSTDREGGRQAHWLRATNQLVLVDAGGTDWNGVKWSTWRNRIRTAVLDNLYNTAWIGYAFRLANTQVSNPPSFDAFNNGDPYSLGFGLEKNPSSEAMGIGCGALADDSFWPLSDMAPFSAPTFGAWAPTEVNSTPKAGNASITHASGLTSTIPATGSGHTLIAYIGLSSSANPSPSVSSVTDSAGNVWVKAAASNPATSKNACEIWYCQQLTAAGVTTVTVKPAADGANIAFTVKEFSGLLVNIGSLDASAATFNSGNAVVSSGLAGASVVATELVTGAIEIGASSPSWNANTLGFKGAAGTILGSDHQDALYASTLSGHNLSLQAGWVNAPAADTYGYGGTLAASSSWAACVATFRGAAPVSVAANPMVPVI